jgi:hypothetical protein
MIARGQKLAEQGLTHSLKKAPGSKKRKKHATTENTTDVPSGSTEKADTASAPKPKNQINTGTPTPASSGNGIKNASTASLAARVLEEENEKKKRRKMMGRNENLDSLFTKKDDGKKSADFMTRGFSIPAARR